MSVAMFIRSAVVWEEIAAPKIRENVCVKVTVSYLRKMTLPFSKDHLGGFLLNLSIEKQREEDWKYCKYCEQEYRTRTGQEYPV